MARRCPGPSINTPVLFCTNAALKMDAKKGKSKEGGVREERSTVRRKKESQKNHKNKDNYVNAWDIGAERVSSISDECCQSGSSYPTS